MMDFGLARDGLARYYKGELIIIMTEQTEQPVEEFTTVQAIFVRRRNCLLLRADFSPLFVDYYLHLMQHHRRNAEAEDTMFKQLLAWFTLHLVSRPWQEYHAWTLNIKDPMLANYFVSGSSLTEDVIGRVFTEGVREPEQNMLFAQNLRTGKEPQTSVIILPGNTMAEWVEDFYRQSEQRQAKAFALDGDQFALITAQPGADHDWLSELTAADVAELEKNEELKVLETRKFTFRCGCTIDKILPTIRTMQKDFADLLSEQGYIEASCPRCGATYKVTPEMLK